LSCHVISAPSDVELRAEITTIEVFAADPAKCKAIVQDLRTAQRGLGELGEILEQPWNVELRK
jgi:hypothetical protein